MIRAEMMSSKRQDLPAGLWIVATPIGNLEDLTPRALRVLQGADLVFCEDTRRTKILFSALQVQGHGRLVRLDAHTDRQRIREWMKAGPGQVFALVSDAGTPGISDPGAQAVAVAREEGIAVHTAPGVSAIATAVSLCGRELPAGFSFRGFFPRKSSERARALEEWLKSPSGSASLWFESPERIQETAEFLQGWEAERNLGGAFFFKELTKIHETVWCSEDHLASEAMLSDLRADPRIARGEWGFMLFRQELEKATEAVAGQPGDQGDFSWRATLQSLLDCEVSVSVASKYVSQRFGVKKKLVYDAALELSHKK